MLLVDELLQLSDHGRRPVAHPANRSQFWVGWRWQATLLEQGQLEQDAVEDIIEFMRDATGEIDKMVQELLLSGVLLLFLPHKPLPCCPAAAEPGRVPKPNALAQGLEQGRETLVC